MVRDESNTFGKLIKTYRELRGWKQEELAERWGYSREYLSQVERGKRKLEKQEQVHKLADILDIPQEQLDAIGKGLPARKLRGQSVKGSDDVLLQALLEPAQNTVKMSWLLCKSRVKGSILLGIYTAYKSVYKALLVCTRGNSTYQRYGCWHIHMKCLESWQ